MLLSSYRNNNENSSYYIEFRVLNGFTYVSTQDIWGAQNTIKNSFYKAFKLNEVVVEKLSEDTQGARLAFPLPVYFLHVFIRSFTNTLSCLFPSSLSCL